VSSSLAEIRCRIEAAHDGFNDQQSADCKLALVALSKMMSAKFNYLIRMPSLTVMGGILFENNDAQAFVMLLRLLTIG